MLSNTPVSSQGEVLQPLKFYVWNSSSNSLENLQSFFDLTSNVKLEPVLIGRSNHTRTQPINIK